MFSVRVPWSELESFAILTIDYWVSMKKYIWNGIGKGKYKVDFQVWVGEVVK